MRLSDRLQKNATRRKKNALQRLFIPENLSDLRRPSWGLDGLQSCPDPLARGILKALGRPKVFVSVPALPKSVNASKIGFRKNVLHPDVKVFQDMVRRVIVMDGSRPDLQEALSSRYVMLIVYESPKWVTQELRIAKRDVDNRVKILSDALILGAKGGDDSNAWSILIFKLHSFEERTTAFLYPLPGAIPVVRGEHDGQVLGI